PRPWMPLAAAAALAFASQTSATTITEDFDPFTGTLTLNKTDDATVGFAADPFNGSNTVLEVTMPGGDEVALLTADLGAGTFFSISARVLTTDLGPLDFDFSGAGFGFTAAGSANQAGTLESNPFLSDTADSGYKLLIKDDFNDTSQRLVIRQAGNDLASTAIPTDLTDTFDQFDVQLTFTGTTQPNGDVALVGTLVDNLGGDDNAVVMATVAAANAEIGTDYGIAQLKLGSGNTARGLYDNVTITVIPEPTSLALAAGLALACGLRRSEV
ncbi:MAG: hypothetical protein AAF805_04645, partial [Planctomycetota bacterium]